MGRQGGREGVRVRNHHSEVCALWHCRAKLTLSVRHVDPTMRIELEAELTFDHDVNDFIFMARSLRKAYLCSCDGYFAKGRCRIEIRIENITPNGSKFRHAAIINWSTPMLDSDVKLVVEGETFYVGKHLLCTASDYFRVLFSRQFKEGNMKRIELDRVSKDEFKAMLNWLHRSSHFEISEDNIFALIQMAHIYGIGSFLEEAEKFLLEDNSIPIFEKITMADHYKLLLLKNKCMTEMRTPTVIVDFTDSQYWEHLTAEMKLELRSKYRFLTGHSLAYRRSRRLAARNRKNAAAPATDEVDPPAPAASALGAPPNPAPARPAPVPNPPQQAAVAVPPPGVPARAPNPPPPPAHQPAAAAAPPIPSAALRQLHALQHQQLQLLQILPALSTPHQLAVSIQQLAASVGLPMPRYFQVLLQQLPGMLQNHQQLQQQWQANMPQPIAPAVPVPPPPPMPAPHQPSMANPNPSGAGPSHGPSIAHRGAPPNPPPAKRSRP